MIKWVVILFVAGPLLPSIEAKISPSLKTKLGLNHKANVIVNFIGGNAQTIKNLDTVIFGSRNDRLNTLKSELEKNAYQEQKNAQQFLNENSVGFVSFWISNQMYLPGVDFKIVEAIISFPEVVEVHEEILIPLHKSVVGQGHQSRPQYNGNKKETANLRVEWGISRIQAVEAWNITRGAGVVVSHIDTGVRYTHEAVRHNFRGAEYGWFDPYEGTQTPVDDDGHGTHIMGTIAGTNGIGVAPDASWIACKGCNLTTCTEANLIACGQWILCPTKPDGTEPNCSKAPALTSCSWGIGKGDSWYEGVTEAWVAGRIIPIFAFGNSGPSCGSVNSPGDYPRVIAVGSTHMEDRISNFSSVGPTLDGRIKPDVCAPGENILSALPDSDTAYGIKRGSSMASRTFTCYLLLSMTPNLTFQQVKDALINGVDTDLLTQNQSCDGRPDHIFPNNQFGYGRINAFKVVRAATMIL